MTYAEQHTVRAVVARPRFALGPVDRQTAPGYLLLSPGLIALAVLIGVPVVQGITLSFTDRYLLEPTTGSFIGLDNYRTFVLSPMFGHYVGNTLIWSVGSLTGNVVIGMALALLLNRDIKF